ncbi:MAG: hypothetical protein ABF461_00330 [Zymomonas mobilis subsp. pomaceae]|uniref:Uncharacterized protein n=1 Tax=Zymomonas mobilis subsp. pomaceae (strain ATCC 29192 / DSM 22645 / JCM 10191 / CCUG 17912 / NBRC 13757 / NCIMB 11200 / NRRL B-4491 / Barker I) TaxID=579138 RepID=F8EUY4_ZYMMT|nr:hypothetical protein [Zymomonas mobilis]AEI37272.1 hypothetical protein Zymop_0369 [Zymomonas mobilis subsp. pomaceae ATCC 29192]MDX5948641.1 hypothetical protein [Zymomonas mobilis subsp. pomaceae]GEB88446.1 hypothetical protein ZMO02_00830 [Zymomonas mobilis subsp. pomaceae]
MTNSQKDEKSVAIPHSTEDNSIMKDIGSDHRRMHVRARDFWVSVLHGRKIPLVSEFDPAAITDFGQHSFLLDFRENTKNPAIVFLGYELRQVDHLTYHVNHIADVPKGSLIAHMATNSHFSEVINHGGPLGFEANFTNYLGYSLMYRGIFMPFSSDGTKIDYLYGVLNWKILSKEKSSSASPSSKTSVDALKNNSPIKDDRQTSILPEIKTEAELAAARHAPAVTTIKLGPVENDYILLLARRKNNDELDIIAQLNEDNIDYNKFFEK